jgi:hypothetical protein
MFLSNEAEKELFFRDKQAMSRPASALEHQQAEV